MIKIIRIYSVVENSVAFDGGGNVVQVLVFFVDLVLHDHELGLEVDETVENDRADRATQRKEPEEPEPN